MPPHPDSAARTHRPRGPSGAARGSEALFHPENHRVFRTILPRSSLRVDGKRDFFYYPPVFLLLCGALARLPYLTAFLVFEATTLGFYLLVLRRILGERSVAILVPLLAFPPVLWTIGLGQNGFLTAGLFGAATLLIDRRPTVAGLLFGALCVKPHFALLVPVALAAGGRWRAVAAAFASAAALCLLSLAVFGWQTWP